MKSSSCNIPSPADRIKFGFIFVVINSLFISFSSGLFGLKNIFYSGLLQSWNSEQLFVFFSYSCGLFLIFAFVGGLLLFAVPILCNLKRLLLIACIFLDFIFLLFLLADSAVQDSLKFSDDSNDIAWGRENSCFFLRDVERDCIDGSGSSYRLLFFYKILFCSNKI